MGLDPITLGTAAIVGLAGWGFNEYSNAQNRKAMKKMSAPKETPSGNLTDKEAKEATNLKAYRAATYFSSPLGVLNTAPRRGSRLSGQ